MRGPKPKPSKIKKLRGNPGKREVNQREPAFEAGIPEPPAHLDASALLEWHRVTTELYEKKVISSVDMASLAIYCQAWSDLVALTRESETEKRYLTTETGYKYKNPLFSDLAKCRKEVQSYAAELGITPSSRSRIRTIEDPARENPKNNLAAHLFGKVKKQ